VFHFFKLSKSKERDYYKLGGPRIFYKYHYKTSELIIMGEIHASMTASLATEYVSIFQQEFEKISNLKLFIESDQQVGEGALELSFINSLKKLALFKSKKIIPSDFRYTEDDVTHFFAILEFIREQITLEPIPVIIKDACFLH
jgi:hypothetical protein